MEKHCSNNEQATAEGVYVVLFAPFTVITHTEKVRTKLCLQRSLNSPIQTLALLT